MGTYGFGFGLGGGVTRVGVWLGRRQKNEGQKDGKLQFLLVPTQGVWRLEKLIAALALRRGRLTSSEYPHLSVPQFFCLPPPAAGEADCGPCAAASPHDQKPES